MEEARVINKIETNLSKEKIEFINAAYTEEVDYQKGAALEGKNEEERKQLTNQALSRVFLARKDAGKGCAENIHEMIYYLKKIIQLIRKSKPVSMIFPKTAVLFLLKKCLIS